MQCIMNMIDKYNVSRETIADLETFQNLVLEWNKKFNLISKSSEKDIWKRHILDSLQLINYIDTEDKTLYDFGSGAGFPGVVLAIFAKHNLPNLNITLIESIKKKAHFLEEVKNALGLNVNIINDRIEKIKLKKSDIITSRALAALENLFEYAIPFSKKDTKLIFPKGISWQVELENAQKKWNFTYDKIPSETSEEGVILIVKNLRRKING